MFTIESNYIIVSKKKKTRDKQKKKIVYEEIVVTLEFVSELQSLSIPSNKYL